MNYNLIVYCVITFLVVVGILKVLDFIDDYKRNKQEIKNLTYENKKKESELEASQDDISSVASRVSKRIRDSISKRSN